MLFFYWYHYIVSLSRIALIKGEVLVLNTTSNSLYDIEHVILFFFLLYTKVP